MAAVVVLSILLVIALGGIVWSRTSGREAIPPPSSAPAPPRAAPTTPPSTRRPSGPAPATAELEAVRDELMSFVEQRRGLTFTSAPPVEVLDDAAFDQRAREAFDRIVPAWERRILAMSTLGVLDGRTDLVAELREREPAGQVARYDSLSRTVVVRGQAVTPYTRSQLVRSLTSALDDQRFGIERPAYVTTTGEILWAFDALATGDAARLAAAWEATLASSERSELERARSDALDGLDLRALPPAATELLSFPFTAGARFAEALAGAGGSRLNDGFADPPNDTAAVLHPERFLGGVAAVEVPRPEVDGHVVAAGVFGEELTVATLTDSPTPEPAAGAASGWAGDSYVMFVRPDGDPCIRIDYRATSPEALDRLFRAYEAWASQPRHAGAEVRLDGDVLSVSRCLARVAGRNPL